jgi:uncharacterized protein YecT (DUF1311 family)
MTIRRVPHIVVVALTVLAARPTAQQARTPAEIRRDLDEQFDRRYILRAQAEKAWDDEMAREKAGDCDGPKTTYEINMCMGQRIDETLANYKRYTDAVRAWHLLPSSRDPDAGGLTGTPPTQEEAIRRFDAAEAAWERYREELCGLVEDMARGGTAAPYVGATCELLVIRNHMRDLGRTFGS